MEISGPPANTLTPCTDAVSCARALHARRSAAFDDGLSAAAADSFASTTESTATVPTGTATTPSTAAGSAADASYASCASRRVLHLPQHMPCEWL